MRKHSFILFIIMIGFSIAVTLYFMSSPLIKRSPFDIPELTSLSKDKSRYLPGDSIQFQAELNQEPEEPITFVISYYHLDNKVEEKRISVSDKRFDWSWKAPLEDYLGYYVTVSSLSKKENGKSIAVDVSSSWVKFPRYGFLSYFSEMHEEDQKETINNLSKYHINGIQFYDWHDEHHLPLKMNAGQPLSNWANIANKPVSFNTVKEYIELAHSNNMQAMSYNLLNGSLSGAEQYGVNLEWYVYKDTDQSQVDTHVLPEQWKSNIYLMDPGNFQWQKYIVNQQKKVFDHLDFDGWHIDQLGDRGETFDAKGEPIVLDETYENFLNYSGEQLLNKTLIMNAVNQYGQNQIARSQVPFLYTEVWEPYETFEDLQKILVENHQTGKPSILAAYMNYESAEREGSFNTSSILYTDALIFSQGGGHIEIGEHMLSKEYFPHRKLSMSKTLEEALMNYYDYLVGYQNLLRDNVEPASLDIDTSARIELSERPEKGRIYTFAKKKKNKKMIHLLNYLDVEHMNWRDSYSDQNAAAIREDLPVSIYEPREIKKVWISSPDWNNGLPETIEFTQEKEEVKLNIPQLQYWDMIVLEY
ncbi:glycoside hydrolase family 66 protein [Halobacillus andaensis]|uniref:glycoside hydrolase family 66 protein n=1 Tax=Halobacillus andaensis TaxID=1176239 RepID=UPI003D72B527